MSTPPVTSLAAEPLLSLAVTVTSEQRVESVLQSIVRGLASQPGVALARIWLLPSIFGHVVSDAPDCLCLVASAGTPINSPGEDWCFLQGHFARVPFNVGKVGQVAASQHPILVEDVASQNDWVVRADWAEREKIRSFAGHPLIVRDKLLGVIAVFSRLPFGQQEFTWLGLFANQAALAIDNAHAEEAVQSSERTLSAIINTIPTTAWTTRPDGYCDFLNQVWLDYAGMTAEQALGWGWTEAIHPTDRQRLLEEWQSCLASGSPVDTEARIRRFDGSYRWFLIRANPLRDAGNILKWYGTCIDIDDRKKVEEALQSNERSLNRIINAIPTTIGSLSADGTPVYCNQAVLEYTGLTFDDVPRADFRARIFHPEDLEKLGEERRLAFTRPLPFESEMRVLGKDGNYRWFLFRYQPVLDETGQIDRWYMAAIDIDDRTRAENVRLEERTRIARELHDTLLQTVQSASLHVSAALRDVSPESPVKPKLERIVQLMSLGID